MEATDDIKKIDDILADVGEFRKHADDLYDRLYRKIDYAKYIEERKIAKRMYGKVPFNQLSFLNKRKVFELIREAINAYITELAIDTKDK